ncbi:MAG: hypothetical protein ACF8Q5_01400 [Phycisphaerales bacterium JB040]
MQIDRASALEHLRAGDGVLPHEDTLVLGVASPRHRSISERVLAAFDGKGRWDDPRETIAWDAEARDPGVLGLDDVSMRIGRSTTFVDGGLSSSGFARAGDAPGFANGEGSLDVLDMSLSWAALDPGPIRLSVLGGVRSFRSSGGLLRTEAMPGGPLSPVVETDDEGLDFRTLPVIGGGLSFLIADGITLSGIASTDTSSLSGGLSSDSGESFYDLVMQTSFDLGSGIGLHAGYQELRTDAGSIGLAEPLDERGLFARLSIEF